MFWKTNTGLFHLHWGCGFPRERLSIASAAGPLAPTQGILLPVLLHLPSRVVHRSRKHITITRRWFRKHHESLSGRHSHFTRTVQSFRSNPRATSCATIQIIRRPSGQSIALVSALQIRGAARSTAVRCFSLTDMIPSVSAKVTSRNSKSMQLLTQPTEVC